MPKLKFLSKTVGKLADRWLLSQANELANDLVTQYGKVEQEAITRFSKMLQEQTDYGVLYGSPSHRHGQFLGTYNPDEITLSTYDKMRFDPQLNAGLQAIKLPILQLTWEVESPNTELREFVESVFRPIWRGLMRSSLTSLDFGFAAHEKVWEVEGMPVKDPVLGKIDSPALIYRKIKSLHPATIELNIDEKGRLKGFTQYPFRSRGDIYNARAFRTKEGTQTFLPIEKTFLFSHALEFGNYYGWSRLKPAYAPWFEYWVVSGLLERYLERFGAPTKIAKAPVGSSQTGVNADGSPKFEDNLTLAERAAAGVRADSTVTFPSMGKDMPGWSLEYMSGADSHSQFLDVLKYLDNIKLRALFVPERVLTQEFATGSGRMVEQQVWIFLNAVKALVQELEDAINKYAVQDLVFFNFGKNAPPVRLVIESISKEREEFLADIYKAMIQKGLAIPDANKIEARLRIPLSGKIPVAMTPQGERVPIETPGEQPRAALSDFVDDPYWLSCANERIAGRMAQAHEILTGV